MFHLGFRLFGFFLRSIAWSEVAVHITRRCLLWFALVPSASYTSTRSTRCQGLHPLNVLRSAFPTILSSRIFFWRLRCKAFLVYTPILWPSIVSPVAVTPDGEGCCSSSLIPSSSAYFTASFTNKRLPDVSALSSNCRTTFIVESALLYNLTAALILVSLYSESIDFRPLPPIFLGP